MKASVFPYYGDKLWIVDELVKYIPGHRVYVEPFLGSGKFFLFKPPSQLEVINDKNGLIANFFCVIRDKRDEFLHKIEFTEYSQSVFLFALDLLNREGFSWDFARSPDVEMAWAVWVVLNMGYGGKLEYDKYFIGFSGFKNLTVSEGAVRYACKRIRERTLIFSDDYKEIVEKFDASDAFFYFDPPYYNSNCGHYDDGKNDIIFELMEMCKRMKAKWVISHYEEGFLVDWAMANKYNIKTFERSVGVNANAVKRVKEMLIFNYGEVFLF